MSFLRREDITEERIAAWIAEGKKLGYKGYMTRQQREASRRRFLSKLHRTDPLWIFGYGSLMWAPAFDHAERAPAMLHGWHRSFCFWTAMGRGTPAMPGLMLALERGGQCQGVAYRIAPSKVHSETEVVWRREMISGVYRPQWVTVSTAKGPRPAVTFVINRGHQLYTGRISRQKVAHHIAFAEGRNGTCRDYLSNTMAHLTQLGIVDRDMKELSRLVRHLRADMPPMEVRPGQTPGQNPTPNPQQEATLAASQNTGRDVA